MATSTNFINFPKHVRKIIVIRSFQMNLDTFLFEHKIYHIHERRVLFVFLKTKPDCIHLMQAVSTTHSSYTNSFDALSFDCIQMQPGSFVHAYRI